jgi:hypothetical protein
MIKKLRRLWFALTKYRCALCGEESYSPDGICAPEKIEGEL